MEIYKKTGLKKMVYLAVLNLAGISYVNGTNAI